MGRLRRWWRLHRYGYVIEEVTYEEGVEFLRSLAQAFADNGAHVQVLDMRGAPAEPEDEATPE